MNENVRNLLIGFSGQRREKRSSKPLISKVAQILIGLLLVITSVFTLVIYTPFITVPQLECFAGNQLFRFLLTGISAVLLLHYLALRSWKLIILPLVIFTILSGELIRNIPIKENSFDVELGKPYSVLTFNSKFYVVRFMKELISDKKNDLICLQEVKLSEFKKRLTYSDNNKWIGYEWYFGNYSDDDESGLLVLSKQPISLIKQIKCPSQHNDKRYYNILKTKWNEKDVYIIPIHLENVDTRHGLDGLIKSWKVRLVQARAIASEINRINEPLVVLGDFNTTPTDRIFRIICNQLTDTWVETGKSLGITWHREAPLFRIDYILYKNFQAADNGKVYPFRFTSDHLVYQVDLF